eukprot:Selendium_serpulae@DN4601_c0_g1_i1.p1
MRSSLGSVAPWGASELHRQRLVAEGVTRLPPSVHPFAPTSPSVASGHSSGSTPLSPWRSLSSGLYQYHAAPTDSHLPKTFRGAPMTFATPPHSAAASPSAARSSRQPPPSPKYVGSPGGRYDAEGGEGPHSGLFRPKRTLSMLMADPEDEQALLMTLPSGLFGRRRSHTKRSAAGLYSDASGAITEEMAPSEGTSPMSGLNPHLRNWTFFCLLCCAILCNYDHGAIPACLGEIQEELQLSYIRQSLIGNLVYIWFLVGSICAGVVFQYFGAKAVLLTSISSLCGVLMVFSFVNNLLLIYIMRFLTGLTQAFPCVFVPVWVTAPRQPPS